MKIEVELDGKVHRAEYTVTGKRVRRFTVSYRGRSESDGVGYSNSDDDALLMESIARLVLLGIIKDTSG